MKDALTEMVGYLLFLTCVMVALATLPACSPKVADISVTAPPVQSCPKLVLPPVPADVMLDISGDKVTANAGGDLLLRGYVRCRSLYRDVPAR